LKDVFITVLMMVAVVWWEGEKNSL
jgi:hypothetical protein